MCGRSWSKRGTTVAVRCHQRWSVRPSIGSGAARNQLAKCATPLCGHSRSDDAAVTPGDAVLHGLHTPPPQKYLKADCHVPGADMKGTSQVSGASTRPTLEGMGPAAHLSEPGFKAGSELMARTSPYLSRASSSEHVLVLTRAVGAWHQAGAKMQFVRLSTRRVGKRWRGGDRMVVRMGRPASSVGHPVHKAGRNCLLLQSP
ncbi:uncharacterized protein B0I36DRAFT_101369 [Microdochium trichocladiopsis]|uniref:Uncharacterized protein n=1 Tax=Microdochium trichocladiopsis TaxID=1682393 RepID=A0A9P8Y830_9PEZI|nr:uncharacterized protein B0I36DRAFT_101369 [Microdochium trichocladiopsis]KAH7032852.1 hypothetical protein B0I36DRAFT_101369 [Microdochium trichocladiopsis]